MSVTTRIGEAAEGSIGLSIAVPPDDLLFFQVAGRNSCGVGPF